MFPADLLGVCDEMGEAGLPVHADPVIGCIAVTHHGSAKVLSEDVFCHLGGAMSIEMKEGEIFIACEPDVMTYAVTAPEGFIAVDHVGDPKGGTLLSRNRATSAPVYPISPIAN